MFEIQNTGTPKNILIRDITQPVGTGYLIHNEFTGTRISGANWLGHYEYYGGRDEIVPVWWIIRPGMPRSKCHRRKSWGYLEHCSERNDLGRLPGSRYLRANLDGRLLISSPGPA